MPLSSKFFTETAGKKLVFSKDMDKVQ